jgi:HK97 family phage prohead protease
VLATKAFKFDVKTAEDKAGQFSGRASVYGVVDAYNDVVMPGAFTRSLEELGGRVVVLNQHNPSDPIGSAQLTDSDTALLATGQLVMELQSSQDMNVRMKAGLINGLSIGYEVLQESYVGNTRQLKDIKLWEISLVTFPANVFARVTDVKGEVALYRAMGRKALDPLVAAALWQVGHVIEDAKFVAALEDVKAGRELSAANRRLIGNAVEAMSTATDVLTRLLADTDPDKHTDLEQLLTTIRSLNAAA